MFLTLLNNLINKKTTVKKRKPKAVKNKGVGAGIGMTAVRDSMCFFRASLIDSITTISLLSSVIPSKFSFTDLHKGALNTFYILVQVSTVRPFLCKKNLSY